MASLQLPKFFYRAKSFEFEGKRKLRASAPCTSKLYEKHQECYSLSRSKIPRGALPIRHNTSSRSTISTSFLSRALLSAVSSSDFDQINSENGLPVPPAHNPQLEFNRVNCLVWVLHESARSFSLAAQTIELARTGPELSMAWVGVDVHAWHKHIAYQVAVYALLQAAIEVELFLSHKRSNNPSPVLPILSPHTNILGERIENQLNMRHPKLVQWFRMVELPRIAGLFIPLFKMWSVDYAGSGVAGIIIAISCCAAVRKLSPGRVSCPLFWASIEDVLVELMELSYSLVSLDKLHPLATEAGFEEDFLSHFGAKVLPGKNIEEVEFWIGLVQKKLSIALHRESVISGMKIFSDKVQEKSLANLGLFAFLGRETRLFLSGMGIKDLDEQVKDFLSYLECGSLLIYPEFSSLPQYQLIMEVVSDEIGWLDFYAAFTSLSNQERKISKQQSIEAEREVVLDTVFTVCYDVFSGFAHFCSSTQQPLDPNVLAFLLQSQSLLSTCLEDYCAAYDRSGELPKIAERVAYNASPSQMNGRANSSVTYTIELMSSGLKRGGPKRRKATIQEGLEPPVTLAKVGHAAESEPVHKRLLRKSTAKLISASADVWMGTQLLLLDILDALRLLMKQLQGHKVTERQRRKIQRTLADVASIIPITILMLLPVSPIGHGAILAGIQKYIPQMIPTTYSSGRLDVVKQLERSKKMGTKSQSNIKGSSSKLL